MVIAEESRSQHENRARALRRLRQTLYLTIRDPFAAAPPAEITAARSSAGRLDLGRKDPRFWPAVGVVLDALEAHAARVAEAAEALGVSTANLVAFLRTVAKVWQRANELRQRHGHKPLH
jgi:hypothetical protein